MKIPLYSPTICRSEMEAVLTRMVEERVGPGEVNKVLSNSASLCFEGSYAVSFRSPPIALNYAFSSLSLSPNASVILSALAPYWIYNEIKKQGLNPIIVDSAPDSIFMDMSKLKEIIEKASLIILDEPLGFMPDAIEEFKALGLPIIEDISQSIGAEFSSFKAGSVGDFAILGLEEHDLLTAGGGAILIANKKDGQASLKKLYDLAYKTDLLPDINASLTLMQLKQSEKNIGLKKEILDLYNKAIAQTKNKTFNIQENDRSPIYSFPVIFSSGTREIEKFVGKKEVEIEKAFKDSIIANLTEMQEIYINATSMFFRTFLFPLYPRLGKKKAIQIAKILSSLP